MILLLFLLLISLENPCVQISNIDRVIYLIKALLYRIKVWIIGYKHHLRSHKHVFWKIQMKRRKAVWNKNINWSCLEYSLKKLCKWSQYMWKILLDKMGKGTIGITLRDIYKCSNVDVILFKFHLSCFWLIKNS